MSDTPSTSWATWAWQAYREGRLVEADTVQPQIKSFDCECGEVGPCKAAFCTPRSTMEPSHE